DALDRDHVEALAADRAARPLLRHVGRGDHVVGDDVAKTVEPPQRQLGQDAALAWHRRRQDHVVDGDPAGGDEQQVVAIGVDVPYLPRVNQLHVGASPSTIGTWVIGRRVIGRRVIGRRVIGRRVTGRCVIGRARQAYYRRPA